MTDIELYEKAKEAYYSGSPIMEDFEFDALEEKLGLANKSYVGTRHNPAYTVKHPFIMGSLSKIQVHRGKNNTEPDWEDILSKLKGYIGTNDVIITPKYDGCSFEVVVMNGKVVQISTRGDGQWGKDITPHITPKVTPDIEYISERYRLMDYVVRGEVLMDKNTFATKYAETFKNPRALVSGLLNREYDNTDTGFMGMLNDLSVVIYEFRIQNSKGEWVDHDWDEFEYPNSPKYYYSSEVIDNAVTLTNFYYDFNVYRNDGCEFPLDGIVIKPVARHRINNLTEARPKDCVAIKFIPQVSETTVTDIVWEQGKTGEMFPVVIVDGVVMDGKTITRASGHNYGWLCDHKVSVGTKVVLSLAGDIIPFIYKVVDTTRYSPEGLCLPTDGDYESDGCHLYKIMDEYQRCSLALKSSVSALGIPGMGPAVAAIIVDWYSRVSESDPDIDEFLGITEQPTPKPVPENILLCNPKDIEEAVGGKTGTKLRKELEKLRKEISLADVIKSCSFRFCGDRMSEQVAKALTGQPADFTSMASEGYSWMNLPESRQMVTLSKVLDGIGKTISDFVPSDNAPSTPDTRIPVILTGEPTNYATKSEFLQCHPEYRNTTSWKEVKIVFTNSLDSTTGKMKKAKEKNIEIHLY